MGEKRTYRTFYTGAIRPIYELFVKPIAALLADKEDEGTLSHGIRRFFHVDTREVYFAKTTAPFRLRGRKWMGARSPTWLEPTSYLNVETDARLIVRLDSKMPDRIDIETNEGDVYSLTAPEWETIRDRVKFVG
jgi:hypothetical protein